MDEQSVRELMKNWGYYVLPQTHHGSLGYTGLLVAIRKQPTEKHFDPQTLRVRLRSLKGIVRWRTLSWMSPSHDSDHVCPGRVIVSDRFDKAVEFFTFGGSLQVILDLDQRLYLFRSPAPILELTPDAESIPDLLACETEILMSEARVQWASEEEFHQRLGEIDPLQFYLGILQSLLIHYERTEVLEQTHHDLHQAILREKAWLVEQGQWPLNPPVLEDLLAPH